MRQGHWWDNILWILIFLFVVPSSLVVASWNSLPGSRLYNVKLFAEDAIVALTISKGAKSELQVAYADKRLADATTMLVQSESADGLEYFRKQMEDAKTALSQAPDGSAKEELRAKYLAALENASHQLEQQKQIISTAHNLPARQASRINNPQEVVVVKEVTKVNYVTQVNQITQVTQVTQVITQIDQTQDQISDIIEQVQQQPAKVAPAAPAAPAFSAPKATATLAPTGTPIPTAAPIGTAEVTSPHAQSSFQAHSTPPDSAASKEEKKNESKDEQEDITPSITPGQ